MMLRFRAVVVFLVITSVVFSGAGAFAQTTAVSPDAAKILQVLQGSGYQFTQHRADVWSINRTGNSLKNMRVVVSVGSDLLVIFVTVAPKARLKMTPEFMLAALRLNNSLDRVKIGIDDDGDFFVRTDTSVRVVDVTELKAQVEQVAAAANEVYEKTSSFMVPN
jgi:hypothetical protein